MTAESRRDPAPSDFAPPPDRVPPIPAAGEVHLWAIPLDPSPERVSALRRHLAPDELARADRFHFERHRRRFAVGRGALRELLGTYLARPAEALAFAYGAKGKPRLDRDDAGTVIFNLSNSHELALVAVALAGSIAALAEGSALDELGVDLERLRPMPDALQIAERFFSAAEREVLAVVPEEFRDEAFFTCWTRKEAYLKAVGDGLSAPLDRFDVTLEPDAPPRFLAIDGDPETAARWSLFHLRPAPGYLGALALPHPGPWTLRAWRWDP